MKKIILIGLTAVFALGLNSCKKDEDKKGGDNTPQTKCYLKSIKETITETGNPTYYGGFVMYYDNSNTITRVGLIDSASGNEDTTSYVLFSYSSGNLTDFKFYQKGQLIINISNAYNSSKKVSQRDFGINTDVGYATINQKYFYDGSGNITHSIRTSSVDNVPFFGKVINKDSAVYNNYTPKGRPASLTVFNSFSSTQSGSGAYEFAKEVVYLYDANGNKTKTSAKQKIADPLAETQAATFDLTKTLGDAETAFRLITRVLLEDDWTDPNLDTKDIDVNVATSETRYENSTPITSNTTYTFNDKNSPAASVKIEGNSTTNSAITYTCK